MSDDQGAPSPMIEPVEDGPLVVKHLGALKNSRGEDLPTRDRVALCRCGESNNKPFCDGTHAKIGFLSANTSDGASDARQSTVGAAITIHDNRAICSHAGLCTEGLPAVWRLGTEPWIDAGGADVGAIIAIIEACPSGALSYSIDGVEHRDQDRAPAVTVSRNGPYVVTGGIGLDATPGEGASSEHYALCRCGGSRNKPYCDGTHWRIKFSDEKN